jgi:BirA family transcriptional regulator, biotin operon repressor / biotin---[acetyl-CoA-carboxylase] ligase
VDTQLEHFLAHSGRSYQYLEETDSSQNQIRRWSEQGAAEGTLVVAESQTAGRGRLGRPWQSAPEASLTFSLLLRPMFARDNLPLISFAAAVSLREASELGGLKWPNDFLAPNRKKLAGILVEAAFQGDNVVAVLGIGLNVKNPVPENAAALEDYSSLSRVQVLQRFLERFNDHYQSLYQGSEGVLEAWRRYSYTLGQAVKVKTPQGELEGVAVSLGADGSLLVESGGEMKVISVGEVSLVGTL